MERKTKYLALSGFFVALGLVLPFFTAQIPSIGRALLPMHIPVMLAGFVCGSRSGLLVGLITPLLRSILFGMPPLFPTAIAMTFELAAYGYFAGLLYRWMPKRKINVVVALILAMVGGRIIWGIASLLLLGLGGTIFTWKTFAAGAVLNAVPGIVLQLFLIPALVLFIHGKDFER